MDGARHWERIANVPGAEITQEDGLCQMPATAIRARHKFRGILGRVLQIFRNSSGDQNWLLPTGDLAEQIGERVSDRLLVWVEPEFSGFDEQGIRERLGQGAEVRVIGKNLWVAIKRESLVPVQSETLPAERKPLDVAKELLAAAKKARDCPKQASALTDLGVIHLRQGDVAIAAKLFQRALEIARKFGDKAIESDAQTNLALALRAAGKPEIALKLLHAELVTSRKAGDQFHEKLVLGHLGTLHVAMHDFGKAITAYENALALARDLGDRGHRADLLWRLAIVYAEMGQREQAVATARSAIDVMAEMGNPKSQEYLGFLEMYRLDLDGSLDMPVTRSVVDGSGDDHLDDFGAEPPQSTKTSVPHAASQGPGLLRMALNAAKSMAKFVAGGMNVVPINTYRDRFAACEACPHHTGVRCKICGCFTNVKARLPHEKCPLSKWAK